MTPVKQPPEELDPDAGTMQDDIGEGDGILPPLGLGVDTGLNLNLMRTESSAHDKDYDGGAERA